MNSLCHLSAIAFNFSVVLCDVFCDFYDFFVIFSDFCNVFLGRVNTTEHV